jgi:hypothetical protein
VQRVLPFILEMMVNGANNIAASGFVDRFPSGPWLATHLHHQHLSPAAV